MIGTCGRNIEECSLPVVCCCRQRQRERNAGGTCGHNIEVCLSHWYAAAADDEKGMLMGYLMLAVVISKRAYWYAAADDKEMGMLAECLVLVPVHFVDN